MKFSEQSGADKNIQPMKSMPCVKIPKASFRIHLVTNPSTPRVPQKSTLCSVKTVYGSYYLTSCLKANLRRDFLLRHFMPIISIKIPLSDRRSDKKQFILE